MKTIAFAIVLLALTASAGHATHLENCGFGMGGEAASARPSQTWEQIADLTDVSSPFRCR